MKQHNISYLKWILIVLYYILIYVYIRRVVQPELFFHLQQPAFYSNWAFFKEFFNYPGGIAQYLANFFSQIFYIGWAGSFVILGIGMLFMLSGFYILRAYKKSDNNYFWMFIPFILLMAIINDYNFPFVVVIRILIVFLAWWLFIFALKKKVHAIIPLIIISPVIYYLDGSGYLLIYTITAIVSFPFFSEGIKKSIVFLILASGYTYFIDIFSFKYIFNISPHETFFSLLHDDLVVYLHYVPVFIFYAFVFSLPFICLLFFIKYKLYDNFVKFEWSIFKKPLFINTLITRSIVVVIIACMSYFILNSTVDSHSRNIILADYYCYNERWDDVIKVANSDPKYDMFINFNYNRAIDNTGNFLNLFFNYPQFMGAAALYPDMNESSELTMISSDYYFDLGYLTESQHWAYEALIIHPYSIRIMERLVMTNLIFGNYEGARKYLNVLDDNFIAKDFVLKYKPYIEDTNLVSKDKLIMEKRSLLPDSIHTPVFVVNRFTDLITKNSQNKRAFEHKQMCLLLQNKLDLFVNNLKESCKFYGHVPYVYEQGIILYAVTKRDKQLFEFGVSDSTRKTYSDIIESLKNSNYNKEIAKNLLHAYSNTFLYYVVYNSPAVTKIKFKENSTINDIY